jgi:transcriptional repressor NrdR
MMRCPFCNSEEISVLESRTAEDGAALRRRRECGKCGQRFTTYERVEGPQLWVIKKDSRREAFDKNKLRRGLIRACEKRPISMELVEDVADEVEREMLKKGKPEIGSKTIGNAVLKRLKKIDRVAWLRFASVYLNFDDLEDFEEAISKLTS